MRAGNTSLFAGHKGPRWMPRNLSGCVLYFDACSLATPTITTWRDQSGKGHHGTPSGAAPPTWSATGGPKGGPCVTSTGVNGVITTGAFAIAKPCHVFLVAKWNSTALQSSIIDDRTGNRLRFYQGGSSTSVLINGGLDLAANSVTNTAWHYWTLQFNGASSTIKQDGVLKATGDAGSAAASGISLFQFGAGGDNCSGSIARIIVVNRVVTAAEETRIMAFLKAQP